MDLYRISELAVLLIFAMVGDIKSYKINNKLVLIFIGLGFTTNYVLYDTEGLLFAIKGFAFPIVLLFLLFAIKMLGAGDIKLLGAVGAIVGFPLIMDVALFTFIIGGMIALALIIVRKNGRERLRYLYNYLRLCLLTFTIHRYEDFNNKTDGGKFRFSAAIFLGTFTCVFIELMK